MLRPELDEFRNRRLQGSFEFFVDFQLCPRNLIQIKPSIDFDHQRGESALAAEVGQGNHGSEVRRINLHSPTGTLKYSLCRRYQVPATMDSGGANADVGSFRILTEVARQRSRGEAMAVQDEALAVRLQRLACPSLQSVMVGKVVLRHKLVTAVG